MNWNMQLRNVMALAILLVLSSALLVLPATAASIPVNGPVVITEPGTYVLTQDITSSSQIVCIEIKASNVVFDGQGHQISGVNNEGSAGIFVSKDASTPVTGVTIKNVRLNNWFYGVYLLNAQNSAIQDVTTTGNANAGMVLYSGSTGNTISGSTLTGNGRGIILSTSSGSNTISGNTLTGNSNQGIYIFDSNGNTVNGNTITNNTNAGLFIYSASANSVYNNNFSNLYNALFGGTIGSNSWNTNQATGTNIVGGPSIGGNFWGNPDGSGYSQTTADSNGDGFCDQPLVITTGNTDNLPLHTPSAVTPTVTPTATTTPGVESPYKDHNLPARVEAEDYDNGGQGVGYSDSTPQNLGNAYRLTEGVDVEAGGSGYDVGYITDGEYLKYTINVTTAGTYTATFNVGSWEAGRTITVSDDDGDIAGTVNVPNTGSSSTFVSVPLTLNLNAGTHVLKLTFNGNHQNIDYIDFSTSVTPTTTATTVPTTTVTVTPTVTTTVTPGNETPYTPHNLPARVEAEDYDNGGEGVAYHDSTAQNLGNAYRLTEGVDVEAGATGYNVGYITDGEYLKYTVNVATAGTYTATFNVGSWEAGRTITISDNDGDAVGTVNVPNTGNDHTYQSVPVTLNLGAGTHVLKLTFNGNHQNIDYIDFSTSVTPTTTATTVPTTTVTVTPTVTTTVTPGNETPYKAYNLPARVEAEDYDNGGEGVAYHDSTAQNLGNAYRLTEGVDVEAGATGYNVGYITDGEYLKYTVNVATAGTYTANFNVGSWEAGRTIAVSVDDTAVGTVNVPNTGNDHTYQSVPLTLNLGAGTHVLKLTFGGNHQNIDYVDFGTAAAPTNTVVPITTITVTPTTTTTPSQTVGAYKPHSLPVRIEAEDYDNGGAGAAYYDTTAGNLGKAYRLDQDVDIEAGASGYDVGYVADGEWLTYTVDIPSAGWYTAFFNVASWADGRSITVSVDNTPVGTVQVPNTGDSTIFVDVPMNLNLPAGSHVLKLSFTGSKQNIDYIDFPSGPHAEMALTTTPTVVKTTSATAVKNNTTASE
ncbi:Carbohydrate binding family 6 [Methanosphaerula palustris E1-9c]|uniref:Carbohydrate binding family 6 n=2 Tax=Methanosphaerula palustris TaxID=475088 RepID=B8GK73_METPE|nr:Carbohydrate binding family 6 [Methanosphaerula palustris E1-9c]